MCKLKQVYAGVEGYALQCKECGHIQLGFGTTILTLNKTDFEIFCDLIRNRTESLTPFSDDQKSIVMPTPMPCCQIFLTEKELHSLNNLLLQAETEMTTNALLQLFN